MDIWNLEGHTSHVLTIAGFGDEFQTAGEVFRFPATFPARFSASRPARCWLEDNGAGYDLIVFHAVWSWINIELASLSRSRRFKYIVIPHGSLDPFDLQKKHFLKTRLGPWLVRPYLQGGTLALCSSPREAELLQCYGAQVRKRVVPWPVAPHVVPVERRTQRHKLRVGERDFVLLFLGRLDYKKGFPILLPAIRRLVDDGVAIKLLVVGPDTANYSAVVTRMIRELKLELVVKLVPAVSGAEKSATFQAADAFVLPSLNENFGIAVVEAMQHGLPVIVSENVYIDHYVRSAGAGMVCAYDVQALVEAIRRLALEPTLRSTMSVAAEALGLSFAPENLRPQYRGLIEDATSVPIQSL